MDGVLRHGMFALPLHSTKLRPGLIPGRSFVSCITTTILALFYDNTFARCNECNPYRQSDIDATERFPLPKISQKESSWAYANDR